MKYKPKHKLRTLGTGCSFGCDGCSGKYHSILKLQDNLAHAEAVLKWQEGEINRLRLHIDSEPCTCVYVGDGDYFTCARCDALGIIK